uniref:BTB domain-containing protein n=1 Tax=Panagrolaimus sp. JU765 TaxID=591449 RepID=A0AC34RAC0_9BILA
MALRIVQNAEIIVPENDLNSEKPFVSVKNQIFLFENYWFIISCTQKDDNVGIYLHVNCPIPVIVTYSFKVNSFAEKFVNTYEKCEGFGSSNFGKKPDLFQDGFMKIHVDLDINFGREMLENVRKEEFHNVALLFDDRFKDFTIFVGKKEIKVHKNIIAVASPVFAAMLEPQCKESQEGSVDIKDFDPVTVRAAVDFMYTRYLNINSPLTTLLNLAKFADKYDLVRKEMIFEGLYKKINLTTILEISKFSAANGLDQIYNKCVEFVARSFDYNARNMKNFEKLDLQFVMDVVVKKYRSF